MGSIINLHQQPHPTTTTQIIEQVIKMNRQIILLQWFQNNDLLHHGSHIKARQGTFPIVTHTWPKVILLLVKHINSALWHVDVLMIARDMNNNNSDIKLDKIVEYIYIMCVGLLFGWLVFRLHHILLFDPSSASLVICIYLPHLCCSMFCPYKSYPTVQYTNGKLLITLFASIAYWIFTTHWEKYSWDIWTRKAETHFLKFL